MEENLNYYTTVSTLVCLPFCLCSALFIPLTTAVHRELHFNIRTTAVKQ